MRILAFLCCLFCLVPSRAQRLSYVLEGLDLSAMASSKILSGDANHKLIKRQGMLLTAGEVNGRSGLFLIDTGSPGLILHEEQLKPGSTQIVHGATGHVSARSAKVPRLRVANLSQKDVPCLFLDLSHTRQILGEDVIGIIGFAQLSAATLRLDMANRQVAFSEPQGQNPLELSSAHVYPFQLHGHLPLLAANVGDQNLWLAFDTGSGINVLSTETLERVKDSFRGRPATRLVAGIDAHSSRATCALVKLTMLEGTEHTNKTFVFMPLEALQAQVPRLDGLLGSEFWNASSYVLDYGNATLTARY